MRRPVDVAQQAGLTLVTRTFDVLASDWDANGHDDVLVVPHDPDALREGELGESLLTFYENDGDGTFTAVPNGFAGRDRHACSFGDMSADGRMDFVCTEGFSSSRGKELGIQRADGTFQDEASSRGLWERGGGRYRTVALFDANNDGFLDMYFTRYYGANNWDGNPTPAEDPPRPNEFWLSEGGTEYERDASFGLEQPIGAPKDASSCAQGADFNADGYEDLLVCAYKSVHLYRNEGGSSFTDVTTEHKLGGYSIDAGLVDLDSDGDLDIVRTRGKNLRVRRFNGTTWNPAHYTLRFDNGAQDLAYGDFNGDGTTDIYLVRRCIRKADRGDILLLNDGTANFTRVDLPGLPARRGCGQSVAALDYDDDGLSDFVVVNGHLKKSGPVQLWSYKAG